MDVSLSGSRVFPVFLILLFCCLAACGDRYDLSTARGQQARIDDANMHLSKGECSAADEAINPLYASPYVTDEVRIIKASAQACFARFNLLKFAANLVGASNYFQALAKSLDNTTGDAARQWMYNAMDVLMQGGNATGAGQRTTAANSFMVFLQFGVISSIIRNYGSPDCCSGAKGANLVYDTLGSPAGEMSDRDACALSAAFSIISDSFGNADLTDKDSQSAVTALNSVCTAAGLSSCAALNRDRTTCDGVNQNSVNAEAVVNGVNAAW